MRVTRAIGTHGRGSSQYLAAVDAEAEVQRRVSSWEDTLRGLRQSR